MADGAREKTMNAAEALLAPALDGGLADRPAIEFGERRVTYAELDREAARFANLCRDLGLGRGDRVLLVVHDRPYAFAAYLGAMKAGAVPIAFNVRASADDLGFAIDDSACRLLVIDAEFLPAYEAALPTLVARPRVLVGDAHVDGYDRLDDRLAGMAPAGAAEAMAPDEMAFWMYTSGTTGTPKAAIHRQATVLAADGFPGTVLGLGPGDRVFCTSKLFFAFSLGHALLGALRLGLTTVLDDGWPDAEAVAAIVERHRPTALFSVPTLYRNMLRDGVAKRPAFRDIRHFVSAGEALPPAIFEQWREATGGEILDGVGATENCYLFLSDRPGRAGDGVVPLPETEVRLVDGDGAPVVGADAPGVMWVRSPSVADGYWRQADKTRAAFDDGWYRTGDVFVRGATGRYSHQGRADDMLKVSGQWVSPAEIEAVAHGAPGVAEAAVVGAENSDGLTRLVMFAIAAPGADPARTEAAIRERLLATLSVYKCPRRIVLVDDMPRTATGKLQRFRLREWARDVVDAAGA